MTTEKHSHSPNMMRVLILALLTSALAGERVDAFEYYSEPIDYWGSGTKDIKADDSKNSTSKAKPKDFSWKKTLDPMDESLEFFREGNHLPPRAYIEMAREPTDDNIKNWFKLMQMKNSLSLRLESRMQAYFRKHQIPQQLSLVSDSGASAEKSPIKPERYRLRLYFHSKCSHCKRMIDTAKELGKKGFYLDLRQVDADTKIRANLPFPVQRATERELKEKQITSWPVLLVADFTTKLIYRINGYQNAASIINTLRSKK